MNEDLVKINNNIFKTLVAITEEEQNTGLMWKKAPTPVMTFAFEKSDVHKFWMMNTIAELDIIFCKSGKVVEIHYGKPLSLDLVGPDYPIDLVVELPFGSVEKYKIANGDNVELKCSIQTLSRKYAKKLAQIT